MSSPRPDEKDASEIPSSLGGSEGEKAMIWEVPSRQFSRCTSRERAVL